MRKFLKEYLWIIVLVFTLFPQLENQSAVQAKGSQVLGAFDAHQNFVFNFAPFGPALPVRAKEISTAVPPEINARSVLAYDPVTGDVLFRRNTEVQLPIASLTKLMTALVASTSPDFNKPITITKDDLVFIAPILRLQAGDKVMPEDLLKAMLIGSANDAAQTLANHFPDRDGFIAAMNAEAKQLGMDNTHFSTPIGFDIVGNYSTADDLQKLVSYVLGKLPFDQIWQKQNYSFSSLNGTKYYIATSNNLVAGHSNIRSIKTGLTPGAKGNMIVEADTNGNGVVLIVLGSPDRDQDTLSLVNYVTNNFFWTN